MKNYIELLEHRTGSFLLTRNMRIEHNANVMCQYVANLCSRVTNVNGFCAGIWVSVFFCCFTLVHLAY